MDQTYVGFEFVLSATESPSSIAICATSWNPLVLVEVLGRELFHEGPVDRYMCRDACSFGRSTQRRS